MTARIPLFLCGEPHRGDDGVAFRAAALLAPDVLMRAEAIAAGQLDAATLLDLPVGAPFVVVDAVAGIAPGEIRSLPLAAVAALGKQRAAQPQRPRASSSHALALEQTLALVEVLRGAPPAGWFVGVGIAAADHGDTLTPAIAAALPAFAAAIRQAVDAIAQPEALPC
jgi:hydrogenase maturation protease